MQLSMQLFLHDESVRKVLIYLACNGFLFFLHGVLVNPLQHICCFMPHHFHSVFIWYIVCQHHRCEIVPQGMECTFWNSCLFDHGFKVIGDLIWRQMN